MIKKLAILFATLMMVLCCTNTVFAEGTATGSITVENAKESETYTAYKIFDVVYSTTGDKYAYTIDSTNEWFNDVKTYADTTDNKLTLTQKAGETTYVVEFQDGFSAPKFAEYLKTKVDTKTGGTNLTVTGGKATASNLDLGYYFVKTTTGALCNLTTTKPEAKIYDKNIGPEIEKTQKDENNTVITGDVQLGQTINYEITGKVPSTTGYETYTYKVTDTMSQGLTFNKDVKVSIDNTDYTNDADIVTITNNASGDGFVVTIDAIKLNQAGKVGTEIKVTYTAVVNENAVGKVENNKAQLEYSNNPNDSTKTDKTPEQKTEVFTAKIVIDKVEKGTETKLANAEFVLYKDVAGVKKYYK